MVDELTWEFMSGVVENLKAPNQFLFNLLMPNRQALEVETVRVETITDNGRQIAPFIRKNGEGLMVPGYGANSYTVDGPNIRIKRPLNVNENLFKRRPGQMNVYAPQSGIVRQNVQQRLAEDLKIMNDMIANAEEYLTAMMLQGQVTYSVEDEEVIQITFAKPSANNVTLSIFWDDDTPANVRVLQTFQLAKTILSDAGRPAPTDVILGSEAADGLMELAEAGVFKWANQPNGNAITVGQLSFIEQFRDDGAMYMGIISDIRVWRYARTAVLKGTTVNMIRPKYAEFISVSGDSGRVMYYAAIPDLDAIEQGAYVGTRFSKSWKQPDPSAQMSLVHSRPLPVPKRPDATVSIKVISG